MVISAPGRDAARRGRGGARQRGQMLPFEPMDHRALYGTSGRADDRRRRRRQHVRSAPHQRRRGARRLIGVRFVNGRGEVDQVRRPGDEERHRPRSRQAAMRRPRHARLPHRGRPSRCCRSPKARRRLVFAGLDDARAVEALSRGAGLALRGQRRGASAGRHRAGGRPARLLRARRLSRLGRLSQRRAARRCSSRSARRTRSTTTASRRAVARHPRRDASSPSRASAPSGASASRRRRRPASSPRSAAHARRALLRLGRRPRLARRTAEGDAGRRGDPRRARALRRPCDAGARARRAARRRRRVPAAGRAADADHRRHQGELRSRRHLQPRPHVCRADAEMPCRPISPPRQLADPHMQASEKILRTCVHCGFCTATCPTYLLLGDELDSPARPHLPHQGHARGRQARRPPRWSSISTAASPASPA